MRCQPLPTPPLHLCASGRKPRGAARANGWLGRYFSFVRLPEDAGHLTVASQGPVPALCGDARSLQPGLGCSCGRLASAGWAGAVPNATCSHDGAGTGPLRIGLRAQQRGTHTWLVSTACKLRRVLNAPATTGSLQRPACRGARGQASTPPLPRQHRRSETGPMVRKCEHCVHALSVTDAMLYSRQERHAEARGARVVDEKGTGRTIPVSPTVRGRRMRHVLHPTSWADVVQASEAW